MQTSNRVSRVIEDGKRIEEGTELDDEREAGASVPNAKGSDLTRQSTDYADESGPLPRGQTTPIPSGCSLWLLR